MNEGVIPTKLKINHQGKVKRPLLEFNVDIKLRQPFYRRPRTNQPGIDLAILCYVDT